MAVHRQECLLRIHRSLGPGSLATNQRSDVRLTRRSSSNRRRELVIMAPAHGVLRDVFDNIERAVAR